MQHIQGISRNQLQMGSLEDKISTENPVRFIDAFVSFIDLKKVGFEPKTLKTEGRPSFQTEVFLKLYLYGYLNGVRSSRRLEKECFRNIEVQWLLEDMRPNYHTICDFRKDNPKALKQLFKLFVSFLQIPAILTTPFQFKVTMQFQLKLTTLIFIKKLLFSAVIIYSNILSHSLKTHFLSF
jgi:transposase